MYKFILITQNNSNPNDGPLSQLKSGNDLIDDVMDQSSRQNLLPTQAENGFIAVVDTTLIWVTVAVSAVSARACRS